ncbi:MAG: glutaredoxin family protein [bacterium]
MRLLKQQCPVLMLFLNWATYIGGVIFWVFQKDYVAALAWLALVPLGWWAYIRVFPAISRYIGYGSINDRPAVKLDRAAVKVVHYTAQGCPFCPVVKRRLLALQEQMAFDLEEVDVTLRPDLLIAKGIRAVPVVEVGGQRLIGHATSEQLAALIRSGMSKHKTNAIALRDTKIERISMPL